MNFNFFVVTFNVLDHGDHDCISFNVCSTDAFNAVMIATDHLSRELHYSCNPKHCKRIIEVVSVVLSPDLSS